jgi:hypothetical protein
MSVPHRISAFLELAEQDIDAARTLAATNNRYAAYHCLLPAWAVDDP